MIHFLTYQHILQSWAACSGSKFASVWIFLLFLVYTEIWGHPVTPPANSRYADLIYLIHINSWKSGAGREGLWEAVKGLMVAFSCQGLTSNEDKWGLFESSSTAVNLTLMKVTKYRQDLQSHLPAMCETGHDSLTGTSFKAQQVLNSFWQTHHSAVKATVSHQ